MGSTAPDAMPSNQLVVKFQESILQESGIQLRPESMILDFGCGSGRHTYEHLDCGYQNVFGYDIQNYVQLRDPSDIARSAFVQKQRLPTSPSPMTILILSSQRPFSSM